MPRSIAARQAAVECCNGKFAQIIELYDLTGIASFRLSDDIQEGE